MSIIVKTGTRIIFPVILLTSLYITLHGDVTPGGGFQGGTILAAALILFIVAYGLDFVESRVGTTFIEVFRCSGALLIVAAALIGMIFGFWFFKNVGVYWYGVPGELGSGGALSIYNIGEMLNVAGGFTLAIYLFTRKSARSQK